MKRVTVAFQIKDNGDGAYWLAPCDHELFDGKEFVNEGQAIQSIIDFKRDNPGEELPGDILFLTKISF